MTLLVNKKTKIKNERFVFAGPHFTWKTKVGVSADTLTVYCLVLTVTLHLAKDKLYL
jgi:hypothetical protein